MSANPKPLAVILAGGQASRMGGENKALLDLGGSPMIAHVIARLLGQVNDVVINANADEDDYAFTGLPVVGDSVGGFAGPLAGILAGLDFAHEQGASHVLSVATDTPFFPLDLSTRLSGLNKDIAIAKTPSDDERPNYHPTFGMWRVDLREDLRAALNSDTRKVMAFVEAKDHGFYEWSKGDFDPFFNVNSPDDMEQAETLLKRAMA